MSVYSAQVCWARFDVPSNQSDSLVSVLYTKDNMLIASAIAAGLVDMDKTDGQPICVGSSCQGCFLQT